MNFWEMISIRGCQYRFQQGALKLVCNRTQGEHKRGHYDHAFVDFPSTEVIHSQAYQMRTENATMQVERGKSPIMITLDDELANDLVTLLAYAVGGEIPPIDMVNFARNMSDAISRALTSSD